MASNADSFTKLNRMVRQFESSPTLPRMLAVNLAEEAITQLRLGFRQQRDPYGTPWAPLQTRSGAALQKTGRLRNSFSRSVTGSGFLITTNVRYAATHQYGATIRAKNKYLTFKVGKGWARKAQVTIPKRSMMPEGTLGPIWSQAFRKTSSSILRKHFSR